MPSTACQFFYIDDEGNFTTDITSENYRNGLHYIHDYITNTYFVCGLWLDESHMNMAVYENVILDTSTIEGAVFIECSRDSISFEHNVIVNVHQFPHKP